LRPPKTETLVVKFFTVLIVKVFLETEWFLEYAEFRLSTPQFAQAQVQIQNAEPNHIFLNLGTI
jgi:hypothetical protein